MNTAFLFQFWPYAAAVLFGVGTLIRWTATREFAGATFDARALFRRARLLVLSLLLLFLGHAAGLFFPRLILQWNSLPSRLYALEALAFAIGLSALLGCTLAMWRHLGNSDGPIGTEMAGAAFLALLFTTLVSGALTAVLLRWGSSWGAVTLAPYTSSLLRGKPAAGLATGMPFLVRLHVFSAFATLALFPATPAASVLTAALSRGLKWISAPAYRLVDLGRVGARRLNPAIWIWPEME
jgi:nitrate reductase gamma subunit